MRTTKGPSRLCALRQAAQRAAGHCAAAILTAMLVTAHADIPAETLRAALEANRDAVLFLGGTLKFLCGRCTNDHDLRILGTAVVVDASGLMMATSPGALADPKSEVKESHLHVVTADEAKVSVRVAFIDRELGVLMLSVEKPEDARAHPFKSLNLAAAAAANPLDELIALRRFDQRLGYPVQAFTVRINAFDPKPRKTWLSADFTSGELPIVPCFNAEGRLVGFCTGKEAILAADEFLDLIRQARNRQTK